MIYDITSIFYLNIYSLNNSSQLIDRKQLTHTIMLSN